MRTASLLTPVLALTALTLLAPQTVSGGAKYRDMPVSAQVRPSFSITAVPSSAFTASRSDASDLSMTTDGTTLVRRSDEVSGSSVISLNVARVRPDVVIEFTADIAEFASAELSAETSWLPGDRVAMQRNPQQVRTVLDQVAVTVLRYKLKNGNGSRPESVALPVLVTVTF